MFTHEVRIDIARVKREAEARGAANMRRRVLRHLRYLDRIGDGSFNVQELIEVVRALGKPKQRRKAKATKGPWVSAKAGGGK
jgi:hypothetical protein